jgi:amino acid adenylation domain-containing protein
MDGLQFHFPVSYAQQRLWLLDHLAPGSTQYIVPVTLRLTTTIDADVLARSLNEIVRRHEILRTTFEVRDGAPLQVVHSSLVVELPVVDLQHVPPEDRESAVRDQAALEARRPFDLTTAPLLRATLYCIGSRDHVLLVVIHHIVADGWSLGLLFSELTAIYPAFLQGLPCPLPDLPIQYADYAVWQRQRLESAVFQKELDYWREQLSKLPAFTLPIRPRSRAPVAPVSRMAMMLPAETVARLAALGRNEGATLFMTLLAGFQAVLYRYSGQEDFAIGTVIANRTRAETEVLIGCFVNTLVLRARLRASDTFCNLLRQARETALGAYAHQELPFERLVEDLRPLREAGRNPLVQILFSLQNTPAVAQHASEQIRAGWELERGSADFDLTVDLWNTPAGLESRWEYRADLFDADAVRRLMRHYRHVLEAVASEPDRPLAHLALMDIDERRALLLQGRGPTVTFPGEPVHCSIAEGTAAWPSRIAAASATETLTYAQLQDRAERLSHELRRRGVRQGDPVGILLPRSPLLGPALLGVLGAGGAFLVVDPRDPPLRLNGLLDHARARVVVTDTVLASRCDLRSRDVVCLDLLDAPDARMGYPPNDVRPNALAYVVYTSGSTGIPKGVLIPHRALTNHCHAVAQRYELGPDDRALQFAPIGFDVALEELLPVWLTGGMVQFPAQDGVLTFSDLNRYIERHRITLLNLPASYWHEWVDHLTRNQGHVPASLRLVVCGSERVSGEKLRNWLELAGTRVRWMNAYGVTEATITATTYEPVDVAADDLPNVVPIGRPLANVHAYVLDQAGEPVPAGATGELHLAGAGVALGYLGQPDLTAAQFPASPLDPAPGARFYRTGDLARFGRDGNIEFLGRRDAQVKVRGFRVELMEIEAALLRHPNVRETVVQQPLDGRELLVAYVVPNGPQPPDASALITFLQAHLPGHMVPSLFIGLSSLPRSSHGKIDRNALPTATDAVAASERIAPRNALESQLADLWAKVLELPQVGVTDNFFELGGHSLLAMQLLSRMRAVLAVEVSLRMLFEMPTIAGLAGLLGHRHASTTPDTAIPSRVGSRTEQSLSPLEVEHLSDAELDAMLTELLAEGDEST